MNSKATLNDLVELVTEKAFKKEPESPYVGLENIGANLGAIISLGSATDSTSVNGVFRPGDILFGKLRPRLKKCTQVKFSGYCSTDILILRAKDEVDPTFAFNVVRSDKVFDTAIGSEAGTKMPRASWKDIKAVPIYRPVKAEQRRIAEVLSTVDVLIEKTEALIEKHEAAGQGLLSELIHSPYGTHGAGRHSYAPLGNVVEINARSVASPYAQFRYLDISTVGPGVYNEEPARVDRSSAPSRARRIVVPGDTILSTVRPNLRAMIHIGRVDEPTLASTGFAVLSPLMGVAAKYVFYLVADQRFTNYLVSRSKGATYPAVAQDDIVEGMVYLPAFKEQQKIADVLDASNEFVLKSRNELLKLRALKLGIMNDLLSGAVTTERLSL